jgi:hypothetical protein
MRRYPGTIVSTITAKLVFCLPLMGTSSHAQKFCDMVFAQCPGPHSGGVVIVPSDVTALSTQLPFCQEDATVTQEIPAPPSIVFIIDNSRSMSQNNTGGNDPNEDRFKVPMDLLDQISATIPNASVGLSIFANRMQFDIRDNPFFAPAFPTDTANQHDAIIPLTALNHVFANGRTGLDTLKTLLAHADNGTLVHATTQPADRVSSGGMGGGDPVRNGTDITLGFEGAKAAMANSTAPKESQFFIFLSDGAPGNVDESRTALADVFEQGIATPTTFTLYFNPNGDVPQTIQTMTTATQNNLYSTSNPKSGFWPVRIPGSELRDLISTNVFSKILPIPTAPKSASVKTGTFTQVSTGITGNSFNLADRIPLTGDQTTFEIQMTYTFQDTTVSPPVLKEKIVPYTITVQRGGAPTPGVTTTCQDRPNLGLYSGGLPVTSVTTDHASLETRVTLANGRVCANCSVQITSAEGTDQESVGLNGMANILSGNFSQTVSGVPIPGNANLEHPNIDSIIVVYSNPNFPLETVRKSFPFVGDGNKLLVADHNNIAQTSTLTPYPPNQQWILGGAPTLVVQTETPGGTCCFSTPTVLASDSAAFVGTVVQATQPFTVDVNIFSTLGEAVNSVNFTVNEAEFNKLPKGPDGKTNYLQVFWNSLAKDGTPVGNGAYIIKTTVTMLPVVGKAAPAPPQSTIRRVGVFRRI